MYAAETTAVVERGILYFRKEDIPNILQETIPGMNQEMQQRMRNENTGEQ